MRRPVRRLGDGSSVLSLVGDPSEILYRVLIFAALMAFTKGRWQKCYIERNAF